MEADGRRVRDSAWSAGRDARTRAPDASCRSGRPRPQPAPEGRRARGGRPRRTRARADTGWPSRCSAIPYRSFMCSLRPRARAASCSFGASFARRRGAAKLGTNVGQAAVVVPSRQQDVVGADGRERVRLRSPRVLPCPERLLAPAGPVQREAEMELDERVARVRGGDAAEAVRASPRASLRAPTRPRPRRSRSGRRSGPHRPPSRPRTAPRPDEARPLRDRRARRGRARAAAVPSACSARRRHARPRRTPRPPRRPFRSPRPPRFPRLRRRASACSRLDHTPGYLTVNDPCIFALCGSQKNVYLPFLSLTLAQVLVPR